MGISVAKQPAFGEVKDSHRDGDARAEAVKNLHPRLVMAKASVGKAIETAIGDAPLKQFGHEGMVSGLTTGEKVPDYLARIYQDKGARRRFALALLEDDTDVIVTTTITVPMKKAGNDEGRR